MSCTAAGEMRGPSVHVRCRRSWGRRGRVCTTSSRPQPPSSAHRERCPGEAGCSTQNLHKPGNGWKNFAWAPNIYTNRRHNLKEKKTTREKHKRRCTGGNAFAAAKRQTGPSQQLCGKSTIKRRDTNLHQEFGQWLITPVDRTRHTPFFPIHLICKTNKRKLSILNGSKWRGHPGAVQAMRVGASGTKAHLLRVSYSWILSSTWLCESPLGGSCLV